MASPTPPKRPSPDETSEEEVKCNVCMKYLSEPKLLSCLHCFCKECLMHKFAEWNPENIIRCPTCNEPTEIPNNDLLFLPTLNYLENVHVTAYKAKLRAISCEKCADAPSSAQKFCRQCGYVCQRCEQVHKDLKGFEDHEIVDFETLQGDIRRYGKVTTMPQKCIGHAKKLKYYCFDCQHLICRDCFNIGEHKRHKYENINESKNARFQTLKTSLKVLEETCQKRVTDGIESVKHVKLDIDKQLSKANEEIEDAVIEAHRVLDERKSELLEQVKVKAKEKHSTLDEQLNTLLSTSAEIDRVYRTVDSCLHSENSADITSAHRFMAEKMQGIIHECESVEVIPAAVANIKTELELPQAIRKSTRIVESSADPTKCSVTIVDEAKVGEKATVLVKTVYENGQPCIEPQEVSAELHLVEEMTEKVATTTIDECSKRGEYKCTYTTNTRGRHLLHVQVNKQTIHNSPFEMYVEMPPSRIKDNCRSIKVEQPYQAIFTSNHQMIISQTVNPAKITLIDGDKQVEFCKDDSLKNYHSSGIAAAKDGSVFIAYNKPCVVKYDHQGQKVCETMSTMFGEQQLKRPGRLQLGKDDKFLYVCDRGNERIVVYDTDLKPIKVFADGALYGDIAFGDDDYAYLSDKNKNVVIKLGGQLNISACIGESILKAPRGLLIHRGHLYVADRNNSRITVFETTGDHKLVATFGTMQNLYDCGSLMIDRNGYIYICNERGNDIHVF